MIRSLVRKLRTVRAAPAQRVTKEDVLAAYRLILDREPENEAQLIRNFPNRRALRDAFLTSREFQENYPLLAPRLDSWIIKESHHGFRIFLSLSDLYVCRYILLDAYEEREVSAIKSIVRAGDTTIDIGANVGFFTLLLARLVGQSGKVFAFEALPFLAETCGRSIRENRFDEICTVHAVALSDMTGTAQFRYAPDTTNFGGGHFAPDESTPAAHLDANVLTARLDDFITETRCSFIKVDVEGAEPKVFRGGASLLRRDRPVILSELLNPQLKRVSGTNANELIRFMNGLDYRCVQLESRIEIVGYQNDEPLNVLFLPVTA